MGIFLLPIGMKSPRFFISIAKSLINTPKSVGERLSPYLTPISTLNHSLKSPCNFTHDMLCSYNDLIAQ